MKVSTAWMHHQTCVDLVLFNLTVMCVCVCFVALTYVIFHLGVMLVHELQQA